MGVSASALSAGKAVLELGLVGSKEVDRALRMLQKKTAEIGASFTKLGAGFAAAGGVITASLGACLKTFSDVGSKLVDMSGRTNISIEALSALSYAADQTGASMETLVAAAKFMQKNGVDPATFGEVANRIAKIKDPVARATAAFEAFGSKAGQALLPTIGELGTLVEQAQAAGIVISRDSAEAADRLGDAMGLLKAQITAVSFAIGESLAPYVTKLIESFTGLLPSVISWVRENGALVVGIGALGVAFTSAGVVLGSFGLALTAAVTAAGALTTAAAAITPTIAGFTLAIGAAAAALAGIAIDSGAAGKALDILKKKFEDTASAAGSLYRAWKAAEAFKNGTFYIGGRAIHAPIPSDSPAPAAPSAPAVAAAAVDPNRNNPFADTARDDFALSGIRWGMRAAESLKKVLAAKQKQLGEAMAAAALGLTKARVAPAMKAAKVATSEISYGMSPEAVFDTTFAKQAFGGEGIQREQLGELKGIHRVLKSQSHGLPVV